MNNLKIIFHTYEIDKFISLNDFYNKIRENNLNLLVPYIDNALCLNPEYATRYLLSYHAKTYAKYVINIIPISIIQKEPWSDEQCYYYVENYYINYIEKAYK